MSGEEEIVIEAEELEASEEQCMESTLPRKNCSGASSNGMPNTSSGMWSGGVPRV